MALVYEPLIPLMGLYPSGDLGPLTIYTTKRHVLVWFLKEPPKDPSTPLQNRVRGRFTLAASAWLALTASERSAWKRAAQLAGLRISGFNLYLHWIMTQDRANIATIERQTTIKLL